MPEFCLGRDPFFSVFSQEIWTISDQDEDGLAPLYLLRMDFRLIHVCCFTKLPQQKCSDFLDFNNIKRWNSKGISTKVSGFLQILKNIFYIFVFCMFLLKFPYYSIVSKKCLFASTCELRTFS